MAPSRIVKPPDEPALVFSRWMEWAEAVHDEFIEAAADHRLFVRLRDLTERSPGLAPRAGVWIDWMVRNYATAVVVFIRRQAEPQTGDLSLANALDELRKNAHLVTRGWYVEQWAPQRSWDTWMANEVFDGFGIVRHSSNEMLDHLDPERIKADRKRLTDGTYDVVRFANNEVTHRHRGRRDATWDEVHRARDLVFELFQRYYAILTQRSLMLQPIEVNDPMEAFTFPWIDVASRGGDPTDAEQL